MLQSIISIIFVSFPLPEPMNMKSLVPVRNDSRNTMADATIAFS